MKQLKFERMDKGTKKGKYTPQRRDEDGTFLPVVTDEQRLVIIEDATVSLMRGETTDQIGIRHGVTGRTIRTWIIGDPRASVARNILMAGELCRTVDEMKLADGPLPLARAREEFRAWSWLAERRLPDYYGIKQEVKHTLPQGPLLSITLSTPAPPVPVLDNTSTIDGQVIDSTDV